MDDEELARLEEVKEWAEDTLMWWRAGHEGHEFNMADIAAALAFFRTHPDLDDYNSGNS